MGTKGYHGWYWVVLVGTGWYCRVMGVLGGTMGTAG